MNLNYVKTIGLIILSITIFGACHESNQLNESELEAIESSNTIEGIQYIDGTLHFDSKERFSEFLRKTNEDQSVLEQLKKTFPNFVSSDDRFSSLSAKMKEDISSDPLAYSDFVKIVEVDGDKYAEPIIEDKNI